MDVLAPWPLSSARQELDGMGQARQFICRFGHEWVFLLFCCLSRFGVLLWLHSCFFFLISLLLFCSIVLFLTALADWLGLRFLLPVSIHFYTFGTILFCPWAKQTNKPHIGIRSYRIVPVRCHTFPNCRDRSLHLSHETPTHDLLEIPRLPPVEEKKVRHGWLWRPSGRASKVAKPLPPEKTCSRLDLVQLSLVISQKKGKKKRALEYGSAQGLLSSFSTFLDQCDEWVDIFPWTFLPSFQLVTNGLIDRSFFFFFEELCF